MSERKYSVEEIDLMRKAVGNMFPSGRSYNAAERCKEIEERLRTFMLNGTTPSELKEAEQEFLERHFNRLQAMQSFHEERVK